MKKTLALGMAAAMTATLLAGCGGSASSAASTAESTAASTEATSTAESTGSYTDYSAGFPENVTIQIPVYDRGFEGWNPTDNYYTKWIQSEFGDKYNVTVKYVAIARSNEVQDFNQMIAAGNRHVGAMRDRGKELLERVNIPLSRAAEPPRNFSGGMQQRVQIAKALSNNPPILLLDEVTTGLDLSVQAAVLDLIQQIRRDFNVSMLVVSHDLGVIRMLADRTLVMLDGRVIESGLTDQILEDPQHAYTQQLVYSLL